LDPDTTDNLVVAPLPEALPVRRALRVLCVSVVNTAMTSSIAP
jgi:hypothetical protein